MATFSVNDQVRRALGTGNGTLATFDFDFQVNATSDIKVYVDGTLKTETTHYTVVTDSDVAGLNTDGTGTVKFTSGNIPANNAVVTILSDVPAGRTSVYTAGGNITATSLEQDFDTLTMLVGDREERDTRALTAPVNDPTSVDMTLPSKDNRKGKVLGFNATSGDPEAGPTIADVSTLAAITADIATLADIEDGTDATDAIQNVNAIRTDVTAVAGINTTHLSNVSGVATEVGRLGTADAVSDMNALGTTAIISDMNTLAGITSTLSDAAELQPIKADITALANAIGVATTYAVTVVGGVFYLDGSSKPALTLVRGNTYIFDQSDSTNAGHPLAFRTSADASYTTGVTVTGTAGSAGAKVTIDVASNAPSSLKYYCTVHGNGMGNTITVVNSNLATVASNITNVNNVGSNISDVTTAATNISSIQGASQAATDAAAARDSAKAISAAMGAALDDFDDRYLGTMADTQTAPANVTPTITTTNGSADITVSSASGISIGMKVTSTNIPAGTNVIGISGTTISLDNSATAAASGTASTFSAHGVYGTFSSAIDGPSTDNDGDTLETGTLYFNTTDNEMRVYDGANWIAASAAGSASMIIYEYTVSGSAATTFSGADDNGLTLSYTTDNVIVVKDGVILHDDDYTSTSGTSIVLASSAAVGSEIVIYAFKSFTVADTVSKASGGTFDSSVTVTGTLNATTDVQVNGASVATMGKSIAMAIVFGG